MIRGWRKSWIELFYLIIYKEVDKVIYFSMKMINFVAEIKKYINGQKEIFNQQEQIGALEE